MINPENGAATLSVWLLKVKLLARLHTNEADARHLAPPLHYADSEEEEEDDAVSPEHFLTCSWAVPAGRCSVA